MIIAFSYDKSIKGFRELNEEEWKTLINFFDTFPEDYISIVHYWRFYWFDGRTLNLYDDINKKLYTICFNCNNVIDIIVEEQDGIIYGECDICKHPITIDLKKVWK